MQDVQRLLFLSSIYKKAMRDMKGSIVVIFFLSTYSFFQHIKVFLAVL